MKYHYSWRQFTYFVVLNQGLVPFASRIKFSIYLRTIYARDKVWWGVWLGRHIC